MKRFFVFIFGLSLPFVSALSQIRYMELMDTDLRTFPVTMVECVRTDIPPVIDGRLDDNVWDMAEVHSDFKITDRQSFGRSASRQTEVRMLYDDMYIYVAFVCHEPDIELMHVENKRFDCQDILYDDRLEILLDCAHNHCDIARFVVNPAGVMYDTRLSRPIQYALSYQLGDDNWNTEWRVKTSVLEDRWVGEIAIALDMLADEPVAPGETWGINVVRDSRAESGDGARFEKLAPGRELSALIPVRSKVMGRISDRYIEPVEYADLSFGPQAVSVESLRFHSAYADYNGNIWHKPQYFGDNPFTAVVSNVSDKPLRLRAEIVSPGTGDSAMRYAGCFSLDAGEKKSVDVKVCQRTSGLQYFTFSLFDEDTGNRLYNAIYGTRIPPFVEFDLSAAYDKNASNDYLMAAPVTVRGAMDGCRMELDLYDGNGAVLGRDTLSNMAEYEFRPCLTNVNLCGLSGNYDIKCRLIDTSGNVIGAFVQKFTVSAAEACDSLYAAFEPYCFGGVEGKSLTVHFPSSDRFVFWEHAGYIPWWDIDNMGVTYEFMECWGYGNQGCCEPMQDKEPRYSRPVIVENSPARVVILWRYALADANYRVLFGEWVHEYYRLYPDGTGVRDVILHANSNVPHEIMQPQYIFPSGVIPSQMFSDTVAVLFNRNGDMEVNMFDDPVLKKPESTGQWSEEIFRIMPRDRRHPYLIWSKDNGLFEAPVNNALIKGDVKRSLGGHWPMRPLNVDVYNIVGTDMPYHGWLGALQAEVSADRIPDRWTHLIGITGESDDYLRNVADNWLSPVMPSVNGAACSCYDAFQKAYVLRDISGADLEISFEDMGNGKTVINPIFILKGVSPLDVTASSGSGPLSGNEFRWSMIRYEDEPACLIWIGRTFVCDEKINIELTIN